MLLVGTALETQFAVRVARRLPGFIEAAFFNICFGIVFLCANSLSEGRVSGRG